MAWLSPSLGDPLLRGLRRSAGTAGGERQVSMYGTELAMRRREIWVELTGYALGPARSAGIYWDEDELLRLVDVGSQYAPHRNTARDFMYARPSHASACFTK